MFTVDDSTLEGLSKKKILELYSDCDQKLDFSITRLIYSGEKNFYYTMDSFGKDIGTSLSEEVIYSKEDTLNYLISDFPNDIPTNFNINYDEFTKFGGNVFCVVYLFTIKPNDGTEIKLLRPASGKEVNGVFKGNAEREGINAGDLISYVHFSKTLEKEFFKFNYVNLQVQDGMIKPLPYEDNRDLYNS